MKPTSTTIVIEYIEYEPGDEVTFPYSDDPTRRYVVESFEAPWYTGHKVYPALLYVRGLPYQIREQHVRPALKEENAE